MGRSKGEGGRTKSRPSSSSLAAASLLASDQASAATLGFGGYVGTSRFQTLNAAPFSELDSEMAQHLKRLARKDYNTKLKALAAISSLLKDKPAKEFLSFIPQWLFEYKRLLLDYNREVRRATNETMTNLVLALGRDIVPYLKSLMGPWWFSQFDPIPEVSQAAKGSLQAAFPAQEKRLDAIILCATEIFMYLEENLKLTPQNLSDKAVASDELEEMHQQVISSSLLALTTLIDVLVGIQSERPGFENIKAEPKHASKARNSAISFAEKLFSDNKYFLVFLKSQSPVIRSAAYSVLRSYIRNIPQAFNDKNIKTIGNEILGFFQEKDPSCHSSMWEVILLFSRRFPESYSSVNVQKIVLNRFWQFLRNGCFGSQQVSYPALILFLEVLPPKAIQGDKLFLDFFINLWAGRNLSQMSSADKFVLLRAFKECSLWGLHNASRFCEGDNSIKRFQTLLVQNSVVKLLWQDYICSVSLKDDREPTSKTKAITQAPSYLPELGQCIVEILSCVESLDHELLSPFCEAFQDTCLGVVQEKENHERTTERVVEFLSLLRDAMQKSETWPLVYLVGPSLAKSLPFIKSIDQGSVDGFKLLTASVSVFGPRKMIHELFVNNDDRKNVSESEHFIQVFKEIFVPFCLEGYNISTSARLDLLLVLLDDEFFSEQWSAVISYLTCVEHFESGSDSVESNQLVILTMLLDKARTDISKRNAGEKSRFWQGSFPDHWHHEGLEKTAVSVACSSPPFRTSDTRFLCAIVGGSTEGDTVCFVSDNALILIFKEIFINLLSFLHESSFSWVRNSDSLFPQDLRNFGTGYKSSENVTEMVQISLQVLDGSFFSLNALNDDNLVSSVLAAVFIIDWEGSMLTMSDDKSAENVRARLDICESACAFRSKVTRQFWSNLSFDNRERIGSILIDSIRSAIFKEEKLNVDETTSFCCTWMLELLECLCQDQYQEQRLLDYLLREDESWPKFIVSDFSSREESPVLTFEKNESGNHSFVSLINKIIVKLEPSKIFAGYVETTQNEARFRAWLIAEILCTWKWPGGSVISSFLPLLSAHAKNGTYSSKEILLNSIFNILLGGALVHGGNTAPSLFNVWGASADELERVEEPYLRALLSLLLTFFKDNIWGPQKAMDLFKIIVKNLFIGETINSNCLRIFPWIMSVLIRPLCSPEVRHASFEDYQLRDSIRSWLHRTLSFPPLLTWQNGQDMEEWFQLVMSCYPIEAMGGTSSMKLERTINPEEKALILDLYRKQSHAACASSMVNELPEVQILLARLMTLAIGYCSNDFDKDDWEFSFSHIRRWIQSSVVMMEEFTENINDASSDSSLIEKLEKILLSVDPSNIRLTEHAILSFSWFCDTSNPQAAEDSENDSSLRIEKLEHTKDRILEGILRIFFCTGVVEAIASSYSHEAAHIIASSRVDHPYFWELVASNVVKSSPNARDRAVKSVEFWGLSKGSLSSLYAILFTSKSFPPLQYAAYVVLSSEPVSKMAIVSENTVTGLDGESSGDQEDSSPSEDFHLKEEISYMIDRLPLDVFDMELMAQQRVNVFLAWSLLLSHLTSLPSLSPEREKLVQYIQDSSKSIILDCLFQHIPLELCNTNNLKKKVGELPPSLSGAANAATDAITSGSLSSSVESLWPIEPEKMASLAGAIYGVMIRLLPAYVRGWFGDLRDRSTSSMVESFTRSWCSPPLIADELQQIKKAHFVDENFTVSVSKSANEVVATYTKDEVGIDLVIRLPTSYPLRPVDVECMKSLGISEVKQRKWLMSMMLFVRNQNGALAEAIRVWKRNFDKEFEGVEECPICYSVIHTANHSLPRLACDADVESRPYTAAALNVGHFHFNIGIVRELKFCICREKLYVGF
ncbi:hypothetical protein ACFE04_013227 [Oxalis oulophora]